jgi:hypothetical protein
MKKFVLSLLLCMSATAVLLAAYAFVSAPTPVTGDPDDYEITNSPNADETVMLFVVKLGIQSDGTPSSSGNTYSAINSVQALGSSVNGWILCRAAGGSTLHTIDDPGGTASVLVAPIFSGIVASPCIQHTPTGSSNGSATGAPYTGVTITSTGPALMIGCLAATAVSTVTSSGATSETNMNGNDGTVYVNCAHRRATGAESYNFTWTFSGTQAAFDIGWAISEDGSGASFVPGIVPNFPLRGGGWSYLLPSVTRLPNGNIKVGRPAQRTGWRSW